MGETSCIFLNPASPPSPQLSAQRYFPHPQDINSTSGVLVHPRRKYLHPRLSLLSSPNSLQNTLFKFFKPNVLHNLKLLLTQTKYSFPFFTSSYNLILDTSDLHVHCIPTVSCFLLQLKFSGFYYTYVVTSFNFIYPLSQICSHIL